MAQQIKFLHGISRLANSPIEAPYSLHNARINRFGELVSMRKGLISGGSYPNGPKPWVLWSYRDENGADVDEWITRSDGIRAAETYRNRLYLATDNGLERRDRDGTIETNAPNIQTATITDFVDGANSVNEGYPNGLRYRQFDVDDIDIEGVTMDYYVDYILIPFNKYDEAGPWVELTYHAAPPQGYPIPPTNKVDVKMPEIWVNVSFNTEYVRVYRSLEYSLKNTNRRGRFIYNDYLGPTFSYSVQATPGGGGGYFYDMEHTVDQPGVWQVFTAPSHWPFNLNDSTTFSDRVGPGLDKNMNMWSAQSDNVVGPKAEIMYNHGGTMLYADVDVPTKLPSLSYIRSAFDGLDPEFNGVPAKSVCFQYEYDTVDGPIYGPPFYPGDPLHMGLVPWRGESALLVFVRDKTTDPYKLFERITPNANMKYITRHQYNWGGAGDEDDRKSPTTTAAVSFLSLAFDRIGLRADAKEGPFTHSDYINEDNTIYLADQNRPFEVTYLNAPTPDDRPVLAIAGARLAEDESLRAYDFYVMTDRNVYVAERRDDTIFYDNAIHGVGVQIVEGRPLYEPVQDGVVLVGTDGRVYFLSGRQFVRLDEPIPKLLDDIRDLAYDPNANEVVVHNGDDLWIYNFEDRGWIAHREAKVGENEVIDIGYSPVLRRILMRAESGDVYEWIEDEDSDTLNARVVTQPLRTTGRINIRGIKIDYDPVVYTGRFLAYPNSRQINHSSGDNLLAGRDELAHIMLENAGLNHKGDTVDLTSTIREIAGSSTASLTDAVRRVSPSTFTTTAHWGPAAIVNIEAQNIPFRTSNRKFKIPSQRMRYPKINGRNVVIEVQGFDILREILILTEGTIQKD